MPKKGKAKWIRIEHRQMWLDDRKHMIDVHVFPVCRLLWLNGIETFYSCQGGSAYIKYGKVFRNRAYVQILEKDAKRACKLLSKKHPKIDKGKQRVHKDRVAIRFDPSREADKAIVVGYTSN